MNVEIIDLTRTMHDGMEAYPGDVTGLAVERLADFKPDGYALSRLTFFHAHCGTHFDSPHHFIADGPDVSELPLVFPPIALVDTRAREIGPEELSAAGNLVGKAVLIHTGWDKEIGTERFYRDYPIITPAGAEFLVAQGIAILGLDTPSPDPPDSPDFPVHHVLLGAGIPIVEGLVNLEALIGVQDARFIAFPLKITGVEGTPIRAAAVITT